MNKMKYKILLIVFLMGANMAPAAIFGLTSPSDYTGDSIIGPPLKSVEEADASSEKVEKESGTVPPIKKLRLKYRSKYKKFFGEQTPNQFLEPEEEAVSEADNTEQSENTDNLTAKKEKKSWFKRKRKDKNEKDVSDKQLEPPQEKKLTIQKGDKEVQDRVIMNCEIMDYDNEKAVITAHGNVEITLPDQGVTLYADNVVFDKVANTIAANDKVLIKKNGLEVTGDYIFIDLNEENALISRPVSSLYQMEINAKEANLHENVVTQTDGSILFKKSAP